MEKEIDKLWDTKTGDLIRTLDSHQGRVNSVSCTADAQTLASGSADETIRIWDVREPNSTGIIHSSGAVLCLKFNPTKDHELVFGNSNSLVRFFIFRFTCIVKLSIISGI